jgi:hypothetical protein
VSALALIGCASAPGGSGGGRGRGQQGYGPPPSPIADEMSAGRMTWQVKVREHVDLWLHGYAMLLDDSSAVPLFRPGWRDEINVYKNQRSTLTALDTGRIALIERLKKSPSIAQGQFIAQYFSNMDDLRAGITAFLNSEGDPRRAGDKAPIVAIMAQSFPTAADRVWLRSFWTGLQDEYDRWWHLWWVQTERERTPTLQAMTDAWARLRPRLAGYLRGTQQVGGEILLSLPLSAEGRTVSFGRGMSMAVGFPARVTDVGEGISALTHELAGAMAIQVIIDNTTPAEKRNGVADRMNAAAAVRAGAMILDKAAPEYADGYRRYYLSQARMAGTDFARAFPLPPAIEQALLRQVEIILGGI